MLRPYQQQALDRIWQAHDAGARGIVLVAPTGAGKTVIAAAVVAEALARSQRVLVIAPRREIVAQTSARLTAAGVHHGIIAAGMRQPDAKAQVQLGMAQTVSRRTTSATTTPPDLLVVDEAHIDVYGDVIAAYPDARRLLLTATPLRSSGRSWHDLADVMVEVETVAGLVAAGHLVEPQVWSAQQPDLAGVRRGTSGELSPAEAGARYARPAILGDTVEQWRRHAAARPNHPSHPGRPARRTLVFASSVEHSLALRDALRAAGCRCEHIDGSTPAAERDKALAGLRGGSDGARTLDAVTNYGVLCEGLDLPEIEVVIIARATQSESLWRQMVGRALRHATGKTHAVVVDQGGNAYRHGHPMAARPWSLDGTRVREPGDAEPTPSVTTCMECQAIYESGAAACPRCGAEPTPEVRKPPKALTKAELALLRPDGTSAPTVLVDGVLRAPRPMPPGLSSTWRPAWEQTELARLASGRHWRWSLHAMRALGAPVRIPRGFGW